MVEDIVVVLPLDGADVDVVDAFVVFLSLLTTLFGDDAVPEVVGFEELLTLPLAAAALICVKDKSSKTTYPLSPLPCHASILIFVNGTKQFIRIFVSYYDSNGTPLSFKLVFKHFRRCIHYHSIIINISY